MKFSSANLVLAVICILAVACIQRTQCYTYSRMAKVYKGQCLLQNGAVVPFESVLYDNKRCETTSCYENEGKMFESVAGCGLVSAPEGCQVVQGVGQYPDCCPQVNC